MRKSLAKIVPCSSWRRGRACISVADGITRSPGRGKGEPPADIPRSSAGTPRLADDETLASLESYRDAFYAAGIDVDPALTTLPLALKLQRLEQRLALAQALVHRHLVATMSPLASLSSDLHRMVGGTPEGSAMRGAFMAFEARWGQTFTGGARGTKRAKQVVAAEETKSPR